MSPPNLSVLYYLLYFHNDPYAIILNINKFHSDWQCSFQSPIPILIYFYHFSWPSICFVLRSWLLVFVNNWLLGVGWKPKQYLLEAVVTNNTYYYKGDAKNIVRHNRNVRKIDTSGTCVEHRLTPKRQTKTTAIYLSKEETGNAESVIRLVCVSVHLLLSYLWPCYPPRPLLPT